MRVGTTKRGVASGFGRARGAAGALALGLLGAAVPAVLAGVGGCTDEVPADTTVQVTCVTGRDGSGKAVGCVAGALTDPSGKALEGLRVSACTDVTCLTGTTDADGLYRIEGLPIEPHKMEVLGVAKGYLTMCFYRDITAGTPSIIEHVVRLPALPAAKVAWPAATGGTAEVLAGRLVLEAAPETLKYPLGTEVQEAVAIEVPVADLPPFDVAPWVGKEGKSRAFMVQPFPLKATESASLTLLGEKGVAAGTPYRLYAANALSGKLEEAGMLVADDAGALVMQPGGSLKNLTTLVIVPN